MKDISTTRFCSDAADAHDAASAHHKRSAEHFLTGQLAQAEEEGRLAVAHSKLAQEAEAQIGAEDVGRDGKASTLEAAWQFMS